MPGRWELTADTEEKGWKTISLSIDSELEAKMLIFGLVGFVEVVEPRELKEAVAAQARELLEQWQEQEVVQ